MDNKNLLYIELPNMSCILLIKFSKEKWDLNGCQTLLDNCGIFEEFELQETGSSYAFFNKKKEIKKVDQVTHKYNLYQGISIVTEII